VPGQKRQGSKKFIKLDGKLLGASHAIYTFVLDNQKKKRPAKKRVLSNTLFF
jgi:hypothetical protein